MDVREKTGIIIRKNGQYLVGYSIVTNELRWSISPWDAWITRRRDKALIVSDRVGGTRMLFNPIVGQIKKFIT